MFCLNDRTPKLIAEIGCNHLGDFEIAKVESFRREKLKHAAEAVRQS